jgi:hypothetical protein
MFTGVLFLTPKPSLGLPSVPALIKRGIVRQAGGKGLKHMGTDLVRLSAGM